LRVHRLRVFHLGELERNVSKVGGSIVNDFIRLRSPPYLQAGRSSPSSKDPAGGVLFSTATRATRNGPKMVGLDQWKKDDKGFTVRCVHFITVRRVYFILYFTLFHP
jgi:hypothetical protein